MDERLVLEEGDSVTFEGTGVCFTGAEGREDVGFDLGFELREDVCRNGFCGGLGGGRRFCPLEMAVPGGGTTRSSLPSCIALRRLYAFTSLSIFSSNLSVVLSAFEFSMLASGFRLSFSLIKSEKVFFLSDGIEKPFDFVEEVRVGLLWGG